MVGETMTNKEYRDHEGISRSELNILRTKTPMHLKYAKEHPSEQTPALLEGKAAHKLILEPETFTEEFIIAPKCDRRTSEGKKIYEQFLEECEGKEVITEEIMEKITAMADAIKQNKVAMMFLKGEHERSFFWTDYLTQEPCKVRPDVLAEVEGKKYIVDYKTTTSCADGEFERSVRKYGYKFQSGMYREGVFQCTLDDYGFAFVAQEKTPPYASRVYICSDDFVNEGTDQFRQTIDQYHWCVENDDWYGYTDSMLVGEEEG